MMATQTKPVIAKGPEYKAEVDPVDFFETVSQAFERTVARSDGVIDRFYNLHGHDIQLRFAGPTLTKIASALEHWAMPSSTSPELTIGLWDSASTGTKMPPPPWLGHNRYGRRGEILGYNTDRIRTSFQWGSDVLSVLDIKQGRAVFWTRDANRLPQWEIGSPLRRILHWWLCEHGMQYVHAGAVGTPEGGVLLVGKGGSGKSTTALTCLNSDLVYVSDDYCLVSTEPTPVVLNLYNTGKVRKENLHRVPHLVPFIHNFDELDQEKALFFLNRVLPEKLSKGFPLKAIFIPRVTGKVDTTLSVAPNSAGLNALTISTFHQLPGAGREALQILKRLTDQLPSYYLELGTDLKQIPNVILDYLS